MLFYFPVSLAVNILQLLDVDGIVLILFNPMDTQHMSQDSLMLFDKNSNDLKKMLNKICTEIFMTLWGWESVKY